MLLIEGDGSEYRKGTARGRLGSKLRGGQKVSDPFRVLLRVAGSTVLALVLCFGLILGLTGCGDDKDDTGGITTVSTAAGDGSPVTSDSGMGSQSEGIDAGLLGKWYCESLGETLEFTADAEMIWTMKGEDPSTVLTYSVEDSTIVVSILATEGTGDLPYSIEGGVLTIEDPELGSLTYTRAE
jgi:hypothetical protein